ncbi:MAG TPA: hypothetical protein DHW42_10500 [Candidatus Marinimicrobia bacterium]|nr:hypothetical protein [Candidatus Neomarinimicrobiota bacterium]
MKFFNIQQNKYIKLSGLFQIALLVCMITTSAFAFGDKYAGEFLKIGMGVREMSLGGAAVASPQAVAAVYWNPAFLVENSVLSGQFMHTEEFGGVLNLDYVSLAFPGHSGYAYGVSYFRLGVDDIPDTRSALIDDNGNGQLDSGERLDFGKIGKFGASENALLLAMARPINSKLCIGGNFKILSKSLGSTDAWGFGFNLSALYRLLPSLQVGAIVRDVTTTFLYYPDGDNEFILPSVQLGGVYTFAPSAIPIVFRPSAGLDMIFEGETNQSDLSLGFTSSGFRLGLEIQVKKFILLRAGRDNLGCMHVGFGLETMLGAIDYGLAMGGSYTELGQSHRVGITLHFVELGKSLKRYL